MSKFHILAAGLAVLALGSRPATAGEGNGEPFPGKVTILNGYFASAVDRDTGSAPYPLFLPHTHTAAVPGLVLPCDSNEGVVQSAGSLPVDFTRGTVVHIGYASLQAWLLERERRDYARVGAAQ